MIAQAFIQAERIEDQWGNREIRNTRIYVSGPDPLPVQVDRHGTCVNSAGNREKLVAAGYSIHPRGYRGGTWPETPALTGKKEI